MRPFCPELDSSVHLVTLKTGSLLHSVLLGWWQRNLNAHIHSVYTLKFSRMVSQTTGNSEVCPSLLAIGSEHRDQLRWSRQHVVSLMVVRPWVLQPDKSLSCSQGCWTRSSPISDLYPCRRPHLQTTDRALYATPSLKFCTLKSGEKHCCFSNFIAGELKYREVKWFVWGHTASK